MILLQRFHDAPFIPSKSQKRKRYTINNDVLGIPRSDGAEFCSSGNLLKGRRPSLAEENEDIVKYIEDENWEGLEISVPPVPQYRACHSAVSRPCSAMMMDKKWLFTSTSSEIPLWALQSAIS